jgi:hypothetical protein
MEKTGLSLVDEKKIYHPKHTIKKEWTKTFRAKIKKVIWKTNSYGNVKPLLLLTKTHTIEKHTFGALILGEADQVRHFGWGKGAVVEATINQDLGIDIKKNLNKVEPDLANNCPDCQGVLEWKGLDLYCDAIECPSQGRTLLHRLLKVVNIEANKSNQYFGPSIFHDYLKKFPTNTVPIAIHNYDEFCFSFAQVGHKDTGSRYEVLKRHHPELAEPFQAMELEIEKKLLKGFSPREFWYICNLPGIDMAEAVELSGVNPLELMPDKLEFQLRRVKTPKAIAQTIITNQAYWGSVYLLLRQLTEKIASKYQKKQADDAGTKPRLDV